MHVHISAVAGIISALYTILILGLLNWIAMKYAGSSAFWASYANLFGLS